MYTLAEILHYCKQNKRVCPKAEKWNELWIKLDGRRRTGWGYIPNPPLILGAWWDTSNNQKQERLIEHIQWAEQKEQLEEISIYLRNLKEEDWHHSYE